MAAQKHKTLRWFRAWALAALAFNFSSSNCRSCACASLACRRCLASASSCVMRTDSPWKSSLAFRSASWSDWLVADAISARKALVEVCVDCDEGAALCVDCGEGAALCKAKARFDGRGGMRLEKKYAATPWSQPSRVKIRIAIAKIDKIFSIGIHGNNTKFVRRSGAEAPQLM